MKLKEKILIKAVELFNERGVSSTSPNQIAAELNISVGNLTYHYNTKAILLKEVYVYMSNNSLEFIKLNGYMTLDDFRQIMIRFRDFKMKYSFFFDDIPFIVRNYPEVGKLFEEITAKHFKNARLLFDHYIETHRFIPEENGINYDLLTHNIWSITAFWNIQSMVIAPNVILEKQMDLVDMAWYMILPYLTQKGKEEYDQINDFLSNQKK